jgi:hypothetical protein
MKTTDETLIESVTALEGRVTELEKKPPPPPDDQLEARVTALEGRVTTLEATTAALDDRVTVLEGDEEEVEPEPPDPPEPPPEWLSVTLEFPDGAVHLFETADGTDMGDYTAPKAGFVQRCIRVRNPDLPNFFVDFRPDRDSDRVEVVCWNGEAFGDVPNGYHRDLGAYTATILVDGEEAHVEAVPRHAWGCRWRWASADRPLIRTAEEVVADNFLPRMSLRAARIEGYSGVIVPPVPRPSPPYTTFRGPDPEQTDHKCGLQLAIDGGGERPEIGLVTEWQADWLLRGTASSGNTMFAQAEAFAGDIDFFIPDCTTGGPVDYKSDDLHYWSYTLGREYGGPSYYRIWHAEPVHDWWLHEASSHLPNLFLVPYALTEDPYYIEGQQYLCQWTLGWDIYGRECVYNHVGTRPVTGYTGETRTLGWDVRNVAIAYRISPASPPSWLLPSSYYAAVSDDMVLITDTLFTKNPARQFSLFRLFANDNFWQIFQQSYAVMGMSLADMYGLPGWREQLEFYFGFFDGVLRGTSGWDRQVPQPHDILTTDLAACDSWAAAMADPKVGGLMRQNASFPDAASPGNRQGGSMGNCSQIYAACAVARTRGVPAAEACFAWMQEFIDHNYPNNADNSMGIAFFAKCGFEG